MPPDAFPRLNICQQCVDPTGGAYSASPDPLAGKGEGPRDAPRKEDPGKGRGKKRGGAGERGKLLPPDARF